MTAEKWDYVVRRHGRLDRIIQVGSLTHGGPNQFKCGWCGGTGEIGDGDGVSMHRCHKCNGKGWYAEGEPTKNGSSTP